MLRYRLITGPILIVALLAIVWLDDRLDTVQLHGFWQELFRGKDHPPRGLILFAVALIVAPLAAFELSAIVKANQIHTRRWLTALGALVGLVMTYAIPMDAEVVTAIAIFSTGLIGMFVLSLLTFSQQKNVQGVLAAAGGVMFAMVYLGIMLGFLLLLRRDHTAWWIVGIVFTTKACDIGAYFTGRSIGRHKLIPWLSPGKTWEGLVGGVVSSALVGLGLAALSTVLTDPTDHVPLLVGLFCGVVFALVGQFGDLTMSLLKRGAGIKDSSQILPGMGGMLDVLDSPLMVAPVAFWMLTLLT